MNIYILLRRYGMTEFVEGRTQGFRIVVEVADAQGISPLIFVYQRKPGISETGGPVDEFVNVASPADLEEYGAGAPPLDPTKPFYRLGSVDLVFRNQALLEKAWANIQSDVGELVQSLKLMDQLIVVEEVAFGESSSSSSSSSSS